MENHCTLSKISKPLKNKKKCLKFGNKVIVFLDPFVHILNPLIIVGDEAYNSNSNLKFIINGSVYNYEAPPDSQVVKNIGDSTVETTIQKKISLLLVGDKIATTCKNCQGLIDIKIIGVITVSTASCTFNGTVYLKDYGDLRMVILPSLDNQGYIRINYQFKGDKCVIQHIGTNITPRRTTSYVDIY